MDVKIKTDRPLFHDHATLSRTVATFWDRISSGWRTIWGPHIHHGFYEDGKTFTPIEAQENLLDQLTQRLDIPDACKILDVGCGMGGSSLYLAKKYHASVTGITLSQTQIDIATHEALRQNISRVTFKLEDALQLKSFADNSFDLVWSLESCEQFYDKKRFLQEAYRVLKPGGKLMLATWCSDREEYEKSVARAYRKLCLAFDVPYMPTIAHYKALLQQENFTVTECHDWSSHVEKSWHIGVSLAAAYSFLKLLKMGGWRGLKFVKQLKLMQQGFLEQRVRYGVFFAVKRAF